MQESVKHHQLYAMQFWSLYLAKYDITKLDEVHRGIIKLIAYIQNTESQIRKDHDTESFSYCSKKHPFY